MGGMNLMTDPVCGMKIDPDRAAGKEDHEGRVFYFCSVRCARMFRESPHRYGHAA